MSEAMSGSVVLVTGASSGIGEATARTLAAQGARVALVARRADRLEKLASEIAGHGHTALAIEADITDQQQAVDAVEHTVSDFGRLDVLVNNAGVMLLGPMADAPTEEWDRMIDVNLKGLLYMTHAALPHLIEGAASSERGATDIVNVSSVAGRTVTPHGGVYNLTKHGVGAVSESLRQQHSKQGVRTTIIEPGVVSTELVEHNRDGVREAIEGFISEMSPLAPHDIAEAIEYAVTRPAHVSVNEILIRPTDQP